MSHSSIKIWLHAKLKSYFKYLPLIASLLFNKIAYNNAVKNKFNNTISYFDERKRDSLGFESSLGYLEVSSICDSIYGITFIEVEIKDSLINEAINKNKIKKIYSDKGKLSLEINDKGQLSDCRIEKRFNIQELNDLFQQFVNDLTIKYKDKSITKCIHLMKKTTFEIPITVTLDEF